MRKLTLTFFAGLLMVSYAYAQAPQSSAALELNSTTKGFLPPRMTSLEMNAITSPAKGLCIYNTDVNAACFFNGNNWDCMDAQSLINKTFCGRELFDPRDNNRYNTVQIGSQCWMAENLAYLPSVSSSSAGSQTTPYYYVYGYYGTDVSVAKATSNYQTYGVLYNWPAVMAGATSSNNNPSGVQGVCPSGWHIPSDAEWIELTDALGGESVAGGKMKETGETHWLTPNTGATNISGFTALPGGRRYSNGTFDYLASLGYFWSSTEIGSYAHYRHVSSSSIVVVSAEWGKDFGYSVRCLKDN